jgi:zinc/manganese transport system permease protein
MTVDALIVEPFRSLAFMRTALVAGLALALGNGIIGTLLVLRRMSVDGDVLAHAVMPGAAVGFLYAGPSPGWLSLGGLTARGAARRDAGLVAFYLVALSAGVVLVAWRGSNIDLVRVLFGTILAIDRGALWQIATITSAVVLAAAALYRPLAVGGFDPVFLRATGTRIPYGAAYMAMVVLVLVAGFQAFGTLLAVGPLLLPAAAARCWRLGVAGSMALAIGFGFIASVAGLLVSYHGNLPSGPAIVLAAGLIFGMSLVGAALAGRVMPLVGTERA